MKKIKYRNDKKTFVWHKGEEHGEFKIDNHYKILNGVYKKTTYGDVLKDIDTLLMVYEFDKSCAFLEVIK